MMNLHFLGCPKHDFTNFRGCLSVSVCDKKLLTIFTRDLMHRIFRKFLFSLCFIKLYIMQLDINWCLPTFGGNFSKGEINFAANP